MARFTDLGVVIDAIKAKADILQIVSEDVDVPVPQGGNSPNHFIFCPFHGEKNKGSFNINTRMQKYKCFGCHEAGDVVNWTSKFHGISTAEAVERLASRVNLDLTPYIRPATRQEQIDDRYALIFGAAVEWCHTQFINHQSLYQWYKQDTGFTDEQIAAYRVGYCPSTASLASFLFKGISNLSKHELQKLELDNDTQFNDALVYPVHDLSGHARRVYTKPLHPPPTATYKYLGTTNAHPLFRRDLVYGLYQARKSIRAGGGHVILCEGFKAAIAASAVAVMGTNITDEQLGLLRQVGVRQITTCFDGDQAGYLASLRTIEGAHRFRGIILKIAQLPLDTQCDGLVRQQGKSALDAVIQGAKLPIQFYIDGRYDAEGGLSLEAKYSLLADITPIVSKMNEAEIDISISYLAKTLEVSEEGIRSHIRDLKAADTRLVNDKAEESVIYHVIMEPTNWAKLKSTLFTPEHFELQDHQKIFFALGKTYDQFHTGITERAVADQVKVLYPRDAERLIQKLNGIATGETDYSFEAAATTVLDLWRRRSVIKQSADLQANMMDISQTPLEALHKFRRVSISALDIQDNQAVEPVRVAEKVDKMIQERMTAGSKILGYDFGSALPVLNAALSGIQHGHYYVIAANQGVGKSAFAMNLAIPIAIDQRVPTLWIPQEMPEEDLTIRAYSMMTGINNNALQTGTLDAVQYCKYEDAKRRFAEGNLYFRRPISGSIDEIYAIIEEFKFKYGIKVVVWDYIQLVTPSRDQRGMSEREIISHASSVMQQRVAGSLGLATIVVAQLNRTDYKKGEVRESESMGGSYKIAQDASDVITLAEKSPKQIEEMGKERGNRFINLDKRRGGASDVVLHADYDNHTDISLRFRECTSIAEMMGMNKMMGT